MALTKITSKIWTRSVPFQRLPNPAATEMRDMRRSPTSNSLCLSSRNPSSHNHHEPGQVKSSSKAELKRQYSLSDIQTLRLLSRDPNHSETEEEERDESEDCSSGSRRGTYDYDRVYVGTTWEDTMPQFPEEMSEVAPLRGEDSWGGDQTGLFRSHTRTLSWALLFGAMAVSALVFLAVLAIVLEMKSSTSGPFADPNAAPLTPDLSPPTIEPVILPDVPSPLSTARDLSAVLKLTWPIDDVETKQSKAFLASLNGNSDVVPIIIPVPLFKQATPEIVTEGMNSAAQARTARESLELSLRATSADVRSGSPATFHSVALRAGTPETERRGRAGFEMMRASEQIARSLNLTAEEAAQGIVLRNVSEEDLNEFCSLNVTHKDCNITDPYRSYDGSCNNLKHPLWGSTFQTYRRILLPRYKDGVSVPRAAADGSPLPGARVISLNALSDQPSDDAVASSFLVLWGQFVDHDLASTPQSTGFNGTAIPCCVDGKLQVTQHPECFPISTGDPFYISKGQSCLNFVRSAPSPICGFGPREQFNQVTAYLDASTLYGSTTDEIKDVKGRWGFPTASNQGRLPTSYIDDGRPLPMRSVDLTDGCNSPEQVDQRQFCFKSGDRRVNDYLPQTTLNLVWIRQHNLVSEQLVAWNPHWTETEVFEESRRVVIAQIQHITYNEFLPLLLGKQVVKAAGLGLLPAGYYEDYDDLTDATLSDAFVGAAFRLGHSMTQGLVKMVGPHWKNEDFIQLHKLLFNPYRLYTPGRMDAILRGQAGCPAGRPDLHFSKQLTEHLFQMKNSSFGLDLAALDIQRGRDHGLPSYTEWRQACGLSPVQSFGDLTGIWSHAAAEQVAGIYQSVHDIDLYVGGLAENPLPGGMVGPLFSCLIADQFLRLRKADRFWYEGNIQISPFTTEQLTQLRKTTFARVLCDNSDALESIQARAMEQQESGNNPLVPCSSSLIPSLDFKSWKQAPGINRVSSNKLKLGAAGAIEPQDSLEDLFEEEDVEERVKAEDEKILTLSGVRSSTAAHGKDSKQSKAGGDQMVFHDTKNGIILEWPGQEGNNNNTSG